MKSIGIVSIIVLILTLPVGYNMAIAQTVDKTTSADLDDPPVAKFSASLASPNSSVREIHFFDKSVAGSDIWHWLWNFGDGNTSSEEHPTHEYSADGCYTVSLTVFNLGGTSTRTKYNHITINTLNVPFYKSESLYLDWAAVVASINEYYATYVFSHCKIAEFACDNAYLSPLYNFGQCKCCDDDNNACCIYGGMPMNMMYPFLVDYGYSSATQEVSSVLNIDAIISEIDSGDPVILNHYSALDEYFTHSSYIEGYLVIADSDYEIAYFQVGATQNSQTKGYSWLCVKNGCHLPWTGFSIPLYSTIYLDEPTGGYGDIPIARITSFTPYSNGNGINVEWKSEWEDETDVFMVYRYDEELKKHKPISGMIPSDGSHDSGAGYSYFDPDGAVGDIYTLVEFEESGRMLIQEKAKARSKKPVPKPRKISRERSIEDIRSNTKDLLKKAAPDITSAAAPTSTNYTWVAIYPAEFEDAAEDLLSHRSMRGQIAHGITLEDINSNYSDIETYINHLWNTQEQSLRYVVLFGDASACEYSSSCLETTHDIIPIDRYEDGYEGHDYISDINIADVDDDGYPELSVGRVPAYDEYDVAAYVNKVITYETYDPTRAPLWIPKYNDISFLVYDYDQAGCSGSYVAEIASDLAEYIPSNMDLHYLSAQNYPGDYEDRESATISEFNAGRALMVGLSSASSHWHLMHWLDMHWHKDDPFEISMLAHNRLWPFIIGASCNLAEFNRDWEDETLPSIVEELLLDSSRGAIGFFASSGSTMQSANYELSSLIVRHLYEWGAPSIGHACLAAQNNLISLGGGLEATARAHIFLGDPAIQVFGTSTDMTSEVSCNISHSYEGNTPFSFVCPLGDDENVNLDLSFEFSFGPSDIAAEDITMELYAVDPMGTLVLFSNGPVIADAPASNANSYKTTISHSNFGGYGNGIFIVKLNDQVMGSEYIQFKSPDLNADGLVDVIDLSTISQSYTKCLGDEGYNQWCDYSDDQCVDIVDFSLFSNHYLHAWSSGGQQSSPAIVTSDTRLHLSPKQGPMENIIQIDVSLNNSESMRTMLAALDIGQSSLEYLGWVPDPGSPINAVMTSVEKDGRRVLILGVLSEITAGGNDIHLGKIELRANESVEDLSDGDIYLVFGDILTSTGISRLAGIEIEGGEETPPAMTELGSNYPNPFNPSTTIEFSLAAPGPVTLSIYNASGQLIRTLIDESRTAGVHQAVWDGKDNRGGAVSSGVYFYRMKAGDYDKSRKMILLR